MNLGFWISWFRYHKLKIFPFEYLMWKKRILSREGFQPSFVAILFFKMILSHSKSFMEVLFLYVLMNLGFWIAWFWYHKLNIFSFKHLVEKQRILPREGFQPEFSKSWFKGLDLMFKGFIILIKDKFQTLESESVSLEELKKNRVWIRKHHNNVYYLAA